MYRLSSCHKLTYLWEIIRQKHISEEVSYNQLSLNSLSYIKLDESGLKSPPANDLPTEKLFPKRDLVSFFVNHPFFVIILNGSGHPVYIGHLVKPVPTKYEPISSKEVISSCRFEWSAELSYIGRPTERVAWAMLAVWR